MSRLAKVGIVKVQRSVFTNAPKPQMLIYNKGRTVEFEGDLTDDVAKLLGERLKAFFHARIDNKGVVHLDKPAPDQSW